MPNYPANSARPVAMPPLAPGGAGKGIDYKFEWANWLAAGQTIASYSLSVTPEITVENDFNDDTSVTAIISADAIGAEGTVTCRIVTTPDGLTEEKSMQIRVAEK